MQRYQTAEMLHIYATFSDTFTRLRRKASFFLNFYLATLPSREKGFGEQK
jgi:hypothetical protein